ncbi:hypothetical protein JTE90_026100 [Oedothorax gibbosus]|uniref:CCHC-type domain-containing protein n=1 Tax=Oedothorax gibbosus TaxID=931172 RepID=A0AAV6TLU2_9ARAC|nr:hypothetical protein JTE90_026100 [Oedothorax gibbosus]
MSENSTDNISVREIMNDIIGGSGEGALSQGCLATSASPFMNAIKKIVVDLNYMVDRELSMKKITNLTASNFKMEHNKILLRCMDAESAHLITETKAKTLNEQLKILESQHLSNNQVLTNINENIKILEGLNDRIQTLAESYNENQTRVKNVLDNLDTDLSEGLSKSVAKRPRDDSPVIVIDTEEGTNAMSYRDALVARAPELDLPKPTDLVIPGVNRLIVKLKNNENLEKFKKIIEGDPNLGKLAQAKISKHKKHRLIMFGVPDSITDEVFKKEVEALEDSMGKPIEIIKSFKNGKVITDNKNYIIDVEAQVAQKLVNLGKFVINFNRVRIKKYYNILRCFKCQRFGHAAHKCRHELACAACAGPHDTRQCTSTVVKEVAHSGSRANGAD